MTLGASGESSWALLGSGGQMALRWPLEDHFELFWALVAKWLSYGLWSVILSSSGHWWPNGSQMVSGGHKPCVLWGLVIEDVNFTK